MEQDVYEGEIAVSREIGIFYFGLLTPEFGPIKKPAE